MFGLGEGTLESLVEKLPQFDFALLVLTPDDLVESRDSLQQTPRDNVLLELGLCIGFLGRQRTFAVYDRKADLKLPSDLAGVTIADYQLQAAGGLQASLGAASTAIKNCISKLGKRGPELVSGSIDPSMQFQIIHGLMECADEQFIIFMHQEKAPLQIESSVWSAAMGIKYEYANEDESAGNGFFSVSKLCKQLPDADLLEIDLRGNVSLTERGGEFADWLIEQGHKSTWFETPLGGWGEKPVSRDSWFAR